MNKTLLGLTLLLSVFTVNTHAANNQDSEDRVELKTSFIKGNKELPQVLYIVPWQSIKTVKKKPENMVLHSLYGDIFQPVTAQDFKQ